MARCMWPSRSARINSPPGRSGCLRRESRSKAHTPGPAAAVASISAIRTDICWSLRRRDCGRFIECDDVLFGGGALRGAIVATRRPRQAEMLTQGRAFVLLAEQPALLQLRNDQIAEIVVCARDVRRHHAETVAGVRGEPPFHVVRHL